MATDSSLHTQAPLPEDQNSYFLVCRDHHTLVSESADETIVGTWTYDSKVSGQQERLPVAASLMGASVLDYELITLARRFLEERDLPDAVKAGREMFRPDPTKGEQKYSPPTYGLREPSPFDGKRKLGSAA